MHAVSYGLYHNGRISLRGAADSGLLETYDDDVSRFGNHIHGQLIEGGAEIDTMQGHDYTEEEARDAHGRALKSHGWS